MDKMAPTVVDMFCGVGGFTLGAALAGFNPVASFDCDKDLTASYRSNFPTSKVVLTDLATVPLSEVVEAIPLKHVTAVIGGPPCQGFSNIGLRQDGDPRNDLVTRFFEIVSVVKPELFIMENVPMIGHKKHSVMLQDALNRIPSHYEVLPLLLLNAADFGAATSRTRLFVVGRNPSYVDPISLDEIRDRELQEWFSVKDAIFDVPEPTAISEFEALPYRANREISKYARQLRARPPGRLGSSASYARWKTKVVTGNSRTVHSPSVVSRFEEVSQGKSDAISRYPRLNWERPAPVLRAGTGADRGSFQAARPIHPEIPRVISVREAARLQGFPDWFEFSSTKWHSHRMIGNSVSPILAARLMDLFRDRCE